MYYRKTFKNNIVIPKPKLKDEKVVETEVKNNNKLRKNKDYEHIRDIVQNTDKSYVKNTDNNLKNKKNIKNNFEIA